MERKLVLASASPRRRKLLQLLARDFEVAVSDVDEQSDITEPAELVCELARRKARDIFAARPEDVVIGADTVVYIGNEILGKPRDMADARRMMELLAGNTHQVYTGVCVAYAGGEECDFCCTDVTFDAILPEEMDVYLATNDVLDKAGAYAIQGGAAKFISRVDGCFFNVVGLPVNMLYELMKRSDVTKSLLNI